MSPIASNIQNPPIPSTPASLADPSTVGLKDPALTASTPPPAASQFTLAESVQGAAAFIRETLASVPGMNKLFARAPVEPNPTESTTKKADSLSAANGPGDLKGW